MESVAEQKKTYLASILLPAATYEAQLNAQLLEALGDRTASAGITTPRIMPGPVNRSYFLQEFIAELSRLPFALEFATGETKIQRQIDDYEDGLPDPGNPDGIWRVVNLDVRLELAGLRDAKLLIRELPFEELILINFAFAAATVKSGIGPGENGPQPSGDLPRFRDFLLALIEIFPVLLGTLGLELVAPEALGDYEVNRFALPHRLSLAQLTAPLQPARSGGKFDFVYLSQTLMGADRPFVYDRIEPGLVAPGAAADERYHDLHRVEELHSLAAQAEEAYGRMYNSNYPKDDRDDALGFLAQATRLAGNLGLAEIAAALQQRYDQINGVFNAQFRR
jgi:hypothetical protein